MTDPPAVAVAQRADAVDPRALQDEIDRVGREIAAAERLSARRHPARAVDRRAMAMASRDDELRVALFRLIDVTPACRTPEDLGRHLASFAGELEPSRGVSAALRVADTRAGRSVLGAAVAAAVRHTAHRF